MGSFFIFFEVLRLKKIVILNTLQRYKIKTPFVKFYVIQKSDTSILITNFVAANHLVIRGKTQRNPIEKLTDVA